MKEELMSPFVRGFNNATMMILDSSAEKKNVDFRDIVGSNNDVYIFLGLTGDLSGKVFLSAARENALKLASAMEGKTFERFEEIAVSALQELLNILAGGAITEFFDMGVDIDITPPTFVEGKDLDIRPFYPVISAEISVKDTTVYLNLAVKEKEIKEIKEKLKEKEII